MLDSVQEVTGSCWVETDFSDRQELVSDSVISAIATRGEECMHMGSSFLQVKYHIPGHYSYFFFLQTLVIKVWMCYLHQDL
jgi:hypothetical protein